MNNPMLEIANTLGDLYNQRAKVQVMIWKIEKDIAARKLELTPVEGWQGKNAELRDIEAQRVFSADDILQKYAYALDEMTDAQTRLDAHIQGMEAERRALEWQVRCGLVEALTGNAIQFETPAGDVLYSSFDDVAQNTIDEQGFFVAEDAMHDHPTPAEEYDFLASELDPAPVDEELPF